SGTAAAAIFDATLDTSWSRLDNPITNPATVSEPIDIITRDGDLTLSAFFIVLVTRLAMLLAWLRTLVEPFISPLRKPAIVLEPIPLMEPLRPINGLLMRPGNAPTVLAVLSAPLLICNDIFVIEAPIYPGNFPNDLSRLLTPSPLRFSTSFNPLSVLPKMFFIMPPNAPNTL